MTRQYKMSEAALAQRKVAGKARAKDFTPEYQSQARQALADKVDPSYWRFVGRRGGKKRWYQISLSFLDARREVDERYERRVMSTELPGEFNQFESADVRIERYRVDSGQRLMLEMF